jgi:tetratricopeptide (TPR) repeat protein
LGMYKASNQIALRLAERAPRNLEAQDDLAGTDMLIGGILWQEGKAREALVQYRSANSIMQRVMLADGSDKDFLGDYADIKGHLAEASGETGQAATLYHDSISMWEKRVRQDPLEVNVRDHLAMAVYRLSQVECKLGDMVAARNDIVRADHLIRNAIVGSPDEIEGRKHYEQIVSYHHRIDASPGE